MKAAAILLIRVYRASLSLILGPCCRFVPSCSRYAEEAFEKRGFRNGFMMTVRRILKCHPFHRGGWDPVE